MNDNDVEATTGRAQSGIRTTALVALLVATFRATGSWRALRILIEDGSKRHGLDETEVALRVLYELRWPPIEGDDDALELVASACCGNDDLWWSVTTREPLRAR